MKNLDSRLSQGFGVLPLPSSVSLRDLLRWDQWRVDSRPGDAFDAGELPLPLKQLLSRLTTKIDGPLGDVDLREIEGLCSSKSPLDEFESLDEFAETRSAGLLEGTDEAYVRTLLRWRDLPRIEPYTLARFAWDGRIFFVNNGGSHHFAAARLLAARLGLKVTVRSIISDVAIDPIAIRALSESFHGVAVRTSVIDALSTRPVGTWWTPMPPPLSREWSAVFLERRRGALNDAWLVEKGSVDLESLLRSTTLRSPSRPSI